MKKATTTLAPRLTRPFQRFFELEAAGGILLLVCALLALLWANSPFSEAYFGLWQTVVTVGVGGSVISKPLLLWINDGLMAIFFFVVGLEIKREVLVGELSSPKAAALAVAAALGGMVVPAALYALLNAGTDGLSGWGIPMATDIAFALGVLALMGSRAPLALKVFLTALAIVDDLGAVLVIALFYTAEISWGALGVGGGVLAALVVANRLRIQRPAVYVVLGIALWVACLKSGIHATVAGVLLALTIPARRRIDTHEFLARGNELLRVFARDVQPGRTEPSTDQRDALHALEVTGRHAETPLIRMEHALHGWVAFLIIPLFALANAGVALGGDLGAAFGNRVTLGIVVGLFVGKQIGVTGFAWLAVRLGWAALPARVTWRQIYGVSYLCGIGFTMSLFIANLAFPVTALLDSAKVGILTASLIAGLGGWFMLTRGVNEKAQTPV